MQADPGRSAAANERRTDRRIAVLIVAGTLALYVGSGLALYELVSTIF
jgi:hypothetical protein